jgi:hypothetical protein
MALMKPSRTGCTRAAALAWLTRAVGSGGSASACRPCRPASTGRAAAAASAARPPARAWADRRSARRARIVVGDLRRRYLWWRSRRARCAKQQAQCGSRRAGKCVKPGFRLYGKTASLPKLLRPVDGVDVDAERVRPQRVGVARRLHDDGEDGGPAFGLGELAVLIAALDPGDAEAVGEARMTLETSTATCCLPTLAKGSLARA